MSAFLPAVFGFHLLFKTLRVAKDHHFRTQLTYLTIGTLGMFVLVVSESVFRTSLLGIDSFPFLGSFFLIFQSAFVFFAIVRHRFLNVDVRDAAHEIFSQMHEGVLILDPNQGISDMNGSAQDFFGITEWEKAGCLEQLFGEGYRFDENWLDREIAYSRGDKVRIGLLSQSDLCDRGRLIGKLVIIHDITQAREEERQRVLLEAKVQESHTSRLEALGMLAGGIAHDFNNVLAIVSGYATMLRFDLSGMDEKLLGHTDHIIKAAHRAADLPRKLLTFARRTVSEITVVNMHDTIMDTVSLLQHTIDKRIVITTDLLARHFTLNGDRSQIQNMLLNMAINARDAMPDGGELRLRTRNEEVSAGAAKVRNREAEGGVYVVVDIEDNGTGMTEEVKKRIFDPFFTTKQPGKGTGLGLASAYGIVGSHRGFICVDTEIGKGTAFHAYFPVANGASLVAAERKIATVEKGRGRILLVDDEEDVRVSLAKMLGAIGYTVIAFDNGEGAVKWYREHECAADLVLLDVMMPTMTGDQCAEALQRMDPQARILFMSGYAGVLSEDELEAPSNGSGPFGVLQKPFTIEQLSRVVMAAMGR
jgi:signal transduction histidine kinase/CheY-like chemotaxis protein